MNNAVEELAIRGLIHHLVLQTRAHEPWTKIREQTQAAPDYRVHLADGRDIAVEVTRLSDPEIAKSDALRNACREALERLLANQSPPVAMEFAVWRGVPRRRLGELVSLARELCAAAGHIEPGQSRERSNDVGWIRVTRRDQGDSFCGDGPQFHLAGSHPTVVQALIDKKNEKLGAYRTHEREVWLLLVTGVESHQIAVGETAASSAYLFDFDRAFVLDAASERLDELDRA